VLAFEPAFAQAPAARSRPVERSGAEIVQAQCAKCHQSGVSGAPRIGNRDDWIPRMKQGLDAVVRSAISGHGAMPARGGMANLTDTEMKNAVVYMFNPSKPAAK
jgi:cytochrome c5